MFEFMLIHYLGGINIQYAIAINLNIICTIMKQQSIRFIAYTRLHRL